MSWAAILEWAPLGLMVTLAATAVYLMRRYPPPGLGAALSALASTVDGVLQRFAAWIGH